MAVYNYKVRTVGGGTLQGVIEAPDLTSARNKLQAQRYIVLALSEAKKSPLDIIKGLIPKKGAGSKDVVIFSRQLATMISAGVPAAKAFSIIETQIENKAFKKIITEVREDVEAGQSISEAMKKHPKVFSELYVNMIKAGEEGGTLEQILDRVSEYLEKAEELKSKVKGALVYPAVVLSIAIGVTIFLLTFVIPKFSAIFMSFGRQLPAPTMFLINLSNFLRNNWYFIPVIPVGLILIYRYITSKEKGRLKVDTIYLKLPVFGDLLKKVAISKFTRTLGTLQKAGVNILVSLEVAAKTAGNKLIENAIFYVRGQVKEGQNIAEPLAKTGVFPPMVVQMVNAGQETGKLDTMLSKVADFYDREVDVAVKALTSMIEPLVIVFMGVVIGGIVIAMFLPMFEMSQLAGK